MAQVIHKWKLVGYRRVRTLCGSNELQVHHSPPEEFIERQDYLFNNENKQCKRCKNCKRNNA